MVVLPLMIAHIVSRDAEASILATNYLLLSDNLAEYI